MKKFLFIFVIPLILSCSELGVDETSNNRDFPNQHTHPDPEGTVTVNAINDGDTRFIQGLYGLIDKGNNFTSDWGASYSYYCVTDIGPISGLGNMSDVMPNTFSNRCAVIPGHGYWMFTFGSDNFLVSSKKPAISEGTTLYKVYVDSWITTTGGGICGAVLKYLPVDFTHQYTLPATQSKTGFVLELPTDDAEASEHYSRTNYMRAYPEIKTENGKTYLYVSTEFTNEEKAYGVIAVRLENEYHEIDLV